MTKTFKGTQNACNWFLERAINIAHPYVRMAVGAITKNPKMEEDFFECNI